MQRCRNRGRHRYQARFGNALGPEWAGLIVVIDKNRAHRRRSILDAREQIVPHARILDIAAAAHQFFPKRHAQAHDYSAFDLTLGAPWVDDLARIVRRPIAARIDASRFGVDLNFGQVRCEGIGGIRVAPESL